MFTLDRKVTTQLYVSFGLEVKMCQQSFAFHMAGFFQVLEPQICRTISFLNRFK